MNTSPVLAQLTRRYATKTFDSSKTLDAETLNILTESLRLAPSSFGLQPWKFLVVSDPAIRAQLLPHSRGQTQVTDASHLIVLCAADDVSAQDIHEYVVSIAQTRGVAPETLD
jgi:nitroreductase